MENGISRLGAEAQAFASARQEREQAARRQAALQLGCGIDLPAALQQGDAARQKTIRRVKRFVERERLRGAAGHVGYSLDRHIALSQSLAQLQGNGTKGNGARRRRR